MRLIGFLLAFLGCYSFVVNKDFESFIFIPIGIIIAFFDIIIYYIKLKIFFKLHKDSKENVNSIQAPRARKPRRPRT